MALVRASRLLLAGLVLAASACGEPGDPADASRYSSRDRDGDGVPAIGDCDDGDPSAWYLRPAFRDGDGDGRGAGALAEACAGLTLPPGWSEQSDDCDDGDPTVWWSTTGYRDGDADGAGVAPAVSLCTGGALPAGYAAAAGDCDPGDGTRWRELSYLYRDADGDGVTIWSAGVVCSGDALPARYGSSANGVDCDDGDAERWLAMTGLVDADRDGRGSGSPVTVCTAGALPAGYAAWGPGTWGDCDDANAGAWRTMAGFADEDGDGAGVDPAVSLCTGDALPAGYAATSYDCAPVDPDAWRWHAYAHRDADGDGRTVPQAATICAGAALPAGYLTVASGNDCDDTNGEVWQALTGYLDADGDGVGADGAVEFCTSGVLPARYVALEGDCAANDGTAWRLYAYSFRDADGDGRAVAASGTLCIGASPPAGYLQASAASDCNDLDPDAWTTVTGHADADGDGAGAGAQIAWCTDGTVPSGHAAAGTDCAPDDRTAWRLLPYVAVDRDGDGFTVPSSGQICSGESPPDPYRAVAVGRDCHDGDAGVWAAIVRYRDGDGDGVGAVPRSVFCVGASEPAGYTRGGWDVDDADPAVQWDGADEELLLSL